MVLMKNITHDDKQFFDMFGFLIIRNVLQRPEIKLIEKELDIKAEIEFLPMQPGDVEKTYSDIKKSNKMLDYKPTTNIDIGIKKFIDWYKDYHKI